MPENRGSSRGPDAWLSGLVAPAHTRCTVPAHRLDALRDDGPPRAGPGPRLLSSLAWCDTGMRGGTPPGA
jgi:hypothetical protein